MKGHQVLGLPSLMALWGHNSRARGLESSWSLMSQLFYISFNVSLLLVYEHPTNTWFLGLLV